MLNKEKTRKPDYKVVMAKLSRDEFLRLRQYCESNGETINSAIRRIVMNEVDKPLLNQKSLKDTKNIMFDTNSFDKILSGEIPLDLIKKSISLGYRYFITHIQIDELSDIPDSKKEKRTKLLLFLSTVAPSLIPTESFVLGFSRLGYAKLGTAGYYEKLLNQNKTNIKDAILGETAIKNNFIFITDDKDLLRKVNVLRGIALPPLDFVDRLQKDRTK